MNAVLKWWRRGLIAVTALGAALASFVFLRELALHVGWPEWAAILLPLSVDALAAAALTEYRLTGSKTAVGVAILAIAGSAAGNAYSHLYTTGLLEPGWVAVTAVGAVPAVTVGLVVHLFTARRNQWNSSNDETGDDSRSAGGSDTDISDHQAPTSRLSAGAPAAEKSPPGGENSTETAIPVPEPSGRSTTNGSPTRTDTELISTVLNNSWQNESLDSLVSLLSVSKTRATRIRKMARGEVSTPSQNGGPSSPEQVGAQA